MRKVLFALLLVIALVPSTRAWEEESVGGGAGSGDVVGPAGATADAIVCFSGSTGKSIKECFRITLPAPSIGSTPPTVTSTPAFTFWGTNASPPSGFAANTLYYFNGSDWIDTSAAQFNLAEDTIFPGIYGQTVFTLSQSYFGPGSYARLTVNGLVMDKGVDYSISGNTLYWYNIRYQLETTDELIVSYRVP